MATEFIVPAAIEEVITTFDRSNAPCDEFDIQQALSTARKTLLEPREAENLGAWSEVLAFSLIGGRNRRSPWGTYFGPIGSGTKQDGSTWYSPDIADAESEVLGHWASRAKSMKHPVLKARYADLAWDMSRAIGKTKPDPDMARTAVDAYLQSIAQNLCVKVHARFEAALRALDLAIIIDDGARIDAARAAVLDLNRQVLTSGEGWWWMAFDRLIEEKRARLTEVERDQLIADLESIVARRCVTSDPTVFDPHTTEDAARRLIKYYHKRGKRDDARRLQVVIARTFEHFASLGDAMLASSALQTAANAYRDAGMQKDNQRVRVAMEEQIAASHQQMKPLTIERTISDADMEQFLSVVIAPDIGTTFARIASQFLHRRADLEDEVQDFMERAPLISRLPQSILADNHVAAKVGSVEDDPLGRLIRHATQRIALADIWLITALERAREVHNLMPGHFVGWTARTGLFDNLTLLMEGVTAWYEHDFVKAIHVLVPQVEAGLRSIVSKLNKPVTKAHSTVPGVSVAIGMGDVLYSKDITEALGPDLTLHFLALYADPRGFNLRNDTAHALLHPDRIDLGKVTRIIHTLLVFGVWDQLARARG